MRKKCGEQANERKQAKQLKQGSKDGSKETNLAAVKKGRERKNAEENIFVDSENIISKLVVCYKHIHNCAVNKGKSSNEKKTER